MLKKIQIIGVACCLFFWLNVKNASADAYNPEVEKWIQNAEQALNSLNATPEPEETCSKTGWTSFAKSFLYYENFLEDWQDVVGRNDCLREDIWALEDQLQRINDLGVMEAKKCNENLTVIQNLYRTLHWHINGLRRYGEDSELELKESVNCPNCKKAQYVGTENLNLTYASEIYTKEGCVLTQKNSKKWSEEWEELKGGMNLYKNMKTLLTEENFSAGFSSEDYQEAKEASDEWWGQTWKKVYGYNGKYFSFRHLRDGEEEFFSKTRWKRWGDGVLTAFGNILLPPTIAELVDTYTLQLEVWQALSANQERIATTEDLMQWQKDLTLRYQVSRDIEDDLENYLIAWNNAIKAIIKDKNTNKSVVSEYSKKLKSIADNHLKNLYGSCRE